MWISFPVVEASWNMTAHARKPDFVFRRTGRINLNRPGGGGRRQFSRLLAAEMCPTSGSNVGYTMFRCSVKSTGYLRHSPVSTSLPLSCVTMCHHISIESNTNAMIPKVAWAKSFLSSTQDITRTIRRRKQFYCKIRLFSTTTTKKLYVKRITSQTIKFDFKICASNVLYLSF
jgi:hypothetical protein